KVGVSSLLRRQHLQNQGIQRRRNLRIQLRCWYRRVRQTSWDPWNKCARLERMLSRGEFIKDQPHGENVRRAFHYFTPYLLGGHIPGRPHNRTRLRERR